MARYLVCLEPVELLVGREAVLSEEAGVQLLAQLPEAVQEGDRVLCVAGWERAAEELTAGSITYPLVAVGARPADMRIVALLRKGLAGYFLQPCSDHDLLRLMRTLYR